jgi:hypothetical protein
MASRQALVVDRPDDPGAAHALPRGIDDAPWSLERSSPQRPPLRASQAGSSARWGPYPALSRQERENQ